MDNPYFIHGDTIAISMSLERNNGIRINIGPENLYTKFGFCLPVDSNSLSYFRYLNNEVHMYNQNLSVCGLITSRGEIYEIVMIRADENNSKTRMSRTISHIPRTSDLQFRAFDGKMEERIALAVRMGYDTIEKLLALLGEHTQLRVEDYRFFSISDIVNKLEALKTLPNPEEILQEHFTYA